MRSPITYVLAASLLAASAAAAQMPPPFDLGNERCLDTLSAGAMTRVLVYVHPRVVGDSSAAATNAAALFAQDAANALRPLLGGSSSAVPEGEPRVAWHHMTGAFGVVLFRDGHRRLEGADSLGDGLALLARAIDTLSPAGEAELLPTPGPDSMRIAFTLEWPTVDQGGHVNRPEDRPLVPAFTIAYPWIEPVAPLHVVQPVYPSSGGVRNVEGAVILDFVVDTSGRVERATIHDVWPADRPRLSGYVGEWYRDFVRAVSASVEQSEYRPARIGGCPVRQLIQQPFAFSLSR